MSGILNVGSFVTTEDSFSLDQLEDVVIASETHQDVLRFNDAITQKLLKTLLDCLEGVI